MSVQATGPNNQLPDPKLYDAYIVHNKPGEKIKLPENCKGAIGITIDDKVNGLVHAGLKVFNNISMNVQDIQKSDSHYGVDLSNIMHAFVVTEHKDNENYLDVVESVQAGVTKGKISMGDEDWTSMVLFVPKDENVRALNVQTSEKESKGAGFSGKTAGYGFVAGVTSVFTKKHIFSSQQNKQLIASEVADFIKHGHVRNLSGNPREAVCSQLATRILRISTITAQISHEKMRSYVQMNKNQLQEELVNEMTNSNTPLHKAYWNSKVMEVQAGVDALPFELYRKLILDSHIH